MALEPRVVLVTRETEAQVLNRTYGTTSNALYMLSRTGEEGAKLYKTSNITSLKAEDATNYVVKAVPKSWRHTKVYRSQLDRFLFEPQDIIAVIGQDGLVANVAKYLQDGQPVIGFSDGGTRTIGVLTKNHPTTAEYLFKQAYNHEGLEKRTMVKAELDNGQTIHALNEVFIGHRSHQSARYEITVGQRSEHQSSSGVIVSTGTGRTGWCGSILKERGLNLDLQPQQEKLIFLVREPWTSSYYRDTIQYGYLDNDNLEVRSEIEDDGSIFGDGIEVDHIDFEMGRVAKVSISERKLNLL